MEWLDSHLHLDMLLDHCPQAADWLQRHSCHAVSWAFAPGTIATVAALADSLDTQAAVLAAVNRAEFPCWHLCGVHPRNIPPDLTPEAVAPLLQRRLGAARCIGIGEIGLETGSALEEEILRAQLELARQAGFSHLRLGIHSPRANKPARTQQTLALLADYPDLAWRLVVDHCTPDTIGDILAAGFWAGVTLGPAKSTLADVVRIAAAFPRHIERIMVNTDSGRELHRDVVAATTAPDLTPELRRCLLGGNARRFFGLEHRRCGGNGA
jgi:hypothetical protein